VDKDRKKDMNRKIFCFALSALIFAVSLPAQAQQPTKIPRIGFLGANFPTTNPARQEAFRQGLRELG